MKLFRKTNIKQPQFNSTPTRYFSLDIFAGDATLTGGDPSGLDTNITDCPEDLEYKFNSGVSRIDNVKMWGPLKFDRRLGPIMFNSDDEMDSWFRNKGEPV